MTVAQVITNIDSVEPNQYTQAQKIAWLNQLDGQIFNELILTHEHDDDAEWEPYTATTDELLVPDPYAQETYEYYLKAMIAAANHETVKYNTAMILFNAAYNRYSSYYNRNNLPLPPFPKNRLHF
jgi:hypothetical protein